MSLTSIIGKKGVGKTWYIVHNLLPTVNPRQTLIIDFNKEYKLYLKNASNVFDIYIPPRTGYYTDRPVSLTDKEQKYKNIIIDDYSVHANPSRTKIILDMAKRIDITLVFSGFKNIGIDVLNKSDNIILFHTHDFEFLNENIYKLKHKHIYKHAESLFKNYCKSIDNKDNEFRKFVEINY